VNSLDRRTFLKSALAGGIVTLAASAGLLKPTRVLAAAWPANAFEAKTADDALKALYGAAAPATSPAVTLKAPFQAENGAVVPITVSTSLPKVESIAILVKENPNPLVVKVAFTGAEGYFSARMKMGKTSDVVVVAKSGGKLYAASQQIKVTVGGCGG